MEPNVIKYKPNQALRKLIPLGLATMAILACTIPLVAESSQKYIAYFCLAGLEILFIAGNVGLLVLASFTFQFTESCIILTQMLGKDKRIMWEELSNGIYVRYTDGRQCLLLTPIPLTLEEANRKVSWMRSRGKLLHNGYCLLPLKTAEDQKVLTKMKELAARKLNIGAKSSETSTPPVEEILFQPYLRTHKFICVFAVLIFVVVIMICVFAFKTDQGLLLDLGVILLICDILFFIVAYGTATKMKLTEASISIVSFRGKEQVVYWDKIVCRHNIRDLKGNPYILLAVRNTSVREAERVVSAMSNKVQLKHGYYVLIPLDQQRNSALEYQIQEFVERKTN